MRKKHGATRGFSLVEVTLALGIAAFCLITIFGLLPVGVNSNQLSIEQAAAANLATAVVADLQAIPKGASTTPDQNYFSPRFGVPAPPIPAPPIPVRGTAAQTVAHSFFLREDGFMADANNKIDNGADLSANPRYRVTISYAVPPKVLATTSVYFAVPTRVMVSWPAAADATVSAPKNFSGFFEAAATLNRN